MSRPLRIALIGSRGIPASYSGFETFYEELGTRLAARGHHVTVYNRSHHVVYAEPRYRGVELVSLPSIRTKHLDSLSHAALSMLHALRRDFDIYYLVIAGNSPVCLLPRLRGRKVILNVDGADAEREKWTGFAKYYIRFAERLACRLADVIIADSRVIQQRYRRELGRESVFIPYGANLRPRELEQAKTDVLERYGLEPDGYVLFVSRLTPENHAHTLIESFRRAQTGLKLVLVGDAPYADDYKGLIRSLASGEDVVQTGYLFGRDYWQLSSHCRFFVLPSAIDGTRPVLLEQMGFGNCVLVRDTPANLEVIGDAGLSFRHEMPVESLAQRLAELAKDDATVMALRRAARERVERTYSWEAITDDYERLFYEVLESDAA